MSLLYCGNLILKWVTWMSKVRAKMRWFFADKQKTKKLFLQTTLQLLISELSLPNEVLQVIPSFGACQATVICWSALLSLLDLSQAQGQFSIDRVCAAPGCCQLLRREAFRKLFSFRLLIGWVFKATFAASVKLIWPGAIQEPFSQY